MSTYSPPITRARHASRPGPSRVRPDLATSGFAELGVPEPVVEALAAMGVTAPFPIQSATLPDGLAGRDVLGRAETGSGKTIAFAVPVVGALADRGYRRDPGRPGGLILVPTRELASQVAATVGPLARALGLRCATVYGGVSPRTQIASLGRADIVVATPGRLEDHTAQGHCRLNGVRVTVIDEADHMADLGFLPAVRRLLEQTPTDGQRLLFSATLDGAVDVLANRYLRQPATHAVDRPGGSPVNLEHHLFTVLPADKAAVVAELASGEGRSVLFTRTKHGARKLARQLAGAGIAAVDLHSNLAQKARERNLAAFASGRARVLVATDIAARGIHVDEVSLVVHVDPPAEHKAYLHRSGRTARAGAGGTVVTVATVDQARDVTQLLRKAKVLVESAKVTPGDARTAALLARPGGVPACGTASAVGAGTDRPVGSGSAPAACAGRDRPPASSRPGHRSRVGKGAEMTVGTVKWFNGTKGYGFIAPDGGGNDVFVHHSAIEGNGYKELSEGQRVEFESGDGPKGPQATSVRPA